ncbi:hypothetical protein AXX12_13060 [Anaerosporomusa subterranea]|uniref:Peptidase C45 hydrolase domain-containing protein n=1 Tax=Anaerosporomusa subterranea TaxID=1794912 RepID=A0A154BM95_ANASB|nr:C45 family autoproteolytic acyltransferase/hydolase [Anaerosporomusa subterranea]KYZ75103.1 hypothetical protein AXX12_13060 [Anaerosporomusa subterranea]
MRIKCLAYLLLLLLWLPVNVQACTLWAAAGDAVEGGGTLLVKNRDWPPNHQQQLRLVNPSKGYRYFGLFATGAEPGLKAGINEQGLTVVSATASSIPWVERKQMMKGKAALPELLKSCATVDEALLRTDLFVNAHFLMLADKKQVAYVEIGPEGKYATRTETRGRLAHTNHYVESDMLWANRKVGSSSQTRYDRISSLLDEVKAFSLADFISFSQDQVAGPDNSIWRTGGNPKAARTLATWIVYLPVEGDALVYVRLANPDATESVNQYRLTDIFSGLTDI